MKSPVSHRIVKLALVTGLAALFALLTVGSVLATTPPDRTSHLLSSSAAQLLPRPSATAHSLAVGVTPTAEDDPVNPQPADRDNTNALQPLLSDVPAESGGIFFTGSVPLISSTLSQDWGDFDRDGNLDLALGTSRGISIYHNLKGQLVLSKTL